MYNDYHDLHFYVNLDWEEYITNPTDYFKRLYQLVDFARQHSATVYYHQKQVEEFAKLEEDNYITSVQNQIAVIFEDLEAIKNLGFAFEICFSFKNTSFNKVENIAISSILQHKKNALLSVNIGNHKQTLLSVKSSTDFGKIEFTALNNLKSIHDWILKKLAPRKFNKSDKHGENGKGNWNGESVLLCSKAEAQNLLETAIPDFQEIDYRLFNFDEKHQTYIEFFYENALNQWHGFHLEENDWKRVPQKVNKFFNKY